MSLNVRELVCVPTTWTDIAIFLLTNYAAHALSLKSSSGEPALSAGFFGILALLYPFTGIWRGCQGISCAAIFANNVLDQALRARALCVVGRTATWAPTVEETEVLCKRPKQAKSEPYISTKSLDAFTRTPLYYNIFGRCQLPAGYQLYRLRPRCQVRPRQEAKIERKRSWRQRIIIAVTRDPDILALANSRSVPKLAIAVMQLVFSCATLYKARGSQLQTYGYASFGLTVVPYAAMSLVNLIAGFFSPDFDYLYLVHSKVMEEAEARGGYFEGTVGELVEEEDNSEPIRGSVRPIGAFCARQSTVWEYRCCCLATILVTVAFILPYIALAGFTRFQAQQSSLPQRVWIISWLVSGQTVGIMWIGFAIISDWYTKRTGRRSALIVSFQVVSWGLFLAPAIGGFVYVCKMIKEFGNCVQV